MQIVQNQIKIRHDSKKFRIRSKSDIAVHYLKTYSDRTCTKSVRIRKDSIPNIHHLMLIACTYQLRREFFIITFIHIFCSMQIVQNQIKIRHGSKKYRIRSKLDMAVQ